MRTRFRRFALCLIFLNLLTWFLSSAGGGIDSQGGLNFSLGEHGLDSLSLNGQSLFRSSQSGDLRPAKSLFRAGIDALLPNTQSRVATLNKNTNTIDLVYSWGRVSCAYRKKGEDGLVIQIQIANEGAEELDQVPLHLLELNFPSVPQGGTLEAGMFGYGFKSTLRPLYEHPQLADPEFAVPIIRVNYENGALNFCSDDLGCSIGVPYSTNAPAKTSYPFIVNCRDIKPGTSKTFDVSLRFGSAGASVQNLSGDVLKHYAEKYSFQIKWTDRRPIGAIYLASSGIKVPTNPRRWIMNSHKLDITTDEGQGNFRDALLRLADDSIQVLKNVNAQGMITWDPEGQEFLESCYYGDPRLTPTLAPEMEFKDGGSVSAIDEYFQKFLAAGLKIGVCVRPQQIKMVDGKPMQCAADDEHAAKILEDKIAYAKERWGCTLFYVDSTTVGPRPLNPDVFKAVADAYPDVLLIPENESMRYFAYSAPLNSYVNHKVTSTPEGARIVYPNGFSVLMAPDGDRPEDHSALVAAVRHGDILLFNGWYQNKGVPKIKKLYEEAIEK
jgi:hypothetical protein